MLKWAIDRIEGKADAVETPIGFVPTGDSIDLTGLDMTPADVDAAVSVDKGEWATELASIEEWYAKFGEALPASLRSELDRLVMRQIVPQRARAMAQPPGVMQQEWDDFKARWAK